MENNILEQMYKTAHDNDILVSLMLELLTKCNENCKHCYIPKHDNKGLTKEKIFEIISEFRNMGGLNLSLTGGEIFLRNDIFEIIRYARDLNLRVFLLTNATLVTEEVAKKLKENNIAELSVSLYSLNDNEHDSITGIKGSLGKTLDGIKNAKKYNIPIVIKTPILKDNMNAYVDIAEFCEKNKFKFICSPVIFPKSDGNRDVMKYALSREEMKIIVPKTLKYNPYGGKVYYQEACGNLKYSIAIDADGLVFPCNSFFVSVGDIKKEKLSDIWNNEKLNKIKNIKRDELEHCRDCKLNSKCKRCPAMATLEDGNLYGCSSSAKIIAECI